MDWLIRALARSLIGRIGRRYPVVGVGALVVLFVGHPAFSAEAECPPEWSATFQGITLGGFSSAASACAAVGDQYVDNVNAGAEPGSTTVSGSATATNVAGLSADCEFTGTSTSSCASPGYPPGCPTSGPVNYYFSAAGTVPEDCDQGECDQEAPEIGKTFSGTASSMATADYCHAVAHCKVSVKAQTTLAGTTVYVGTVTAESCGEGDPQVQAADLVENQEKCTTSGDLEICTNPTGSGQCGYLNEEFVCLKNTPSGGCQSFSSGAKVCQANASTPPAPDNGNPGQKAEPDAQIQQKVGSTTNNYSYYSSSTVSLGSGTTTPEAEEGDTEDDDSEDEGEGECADSACVGELPDDLEELDSFADLTQGFIDRIAAAPLLAAVDDIGESLPSGSCPDWDIEVFDQSISLSAPMCAIWSQISAILSAVMLVAWGLLAARIVLSA